MSWRYVPQSVACNSDCNEQASEPLVTSNITTIESMPSCQGLEMAGSTMHPSGMMLPHSTGNPGVDVWISSLLVSHASPSAHLGNDLQKKMSDSCGPISAVSFARLDPNISCWRMYQDFLQPTLLDDDLHQWQPYLQTWPRAGMTRNGKAYQLPPLVPLTKGKESLLLRTPTKADGRQFYALSLRSALKRIRDGRQITWIHQAVIYKQWSKGFANPRFSEAMMGFPLGWSDLKPLERPLFHKSVSTLEDAS